MIVTGSQLKKLRTDAGLTQQQVAQLAGVSQAHIAKIENQKVDPRLSTINKILQVLTEGKGKKCREIMTRNVIFAKPSDKVLKISEKMIEKAISQLPVQKQGKIVGTVMEESIIKNLHIKIAEETVEAIMDSPLPIVSEDVEVNAIRPLLEDHLGVLIVRRGNIVGIITRSDLLKILSQFP